MGNKMENKIKFIEQFKKRTMQFVIRVIKLYQSLPKTGEARIIGDQLLRAASSVGSNYRAVCRARSKKEFFSKLSIVVEEADESVFWLEVLIKAEIVTEIKLRDLLNEANQILSVVSKARKTAG